jgi:hypothetical protein
VSGLDEQPIFIMIRPDSIIKKKINGVLYKFKTEEIFNFHSTGELLCKLKIFKKEGIFTWTKVEIGYINLKGKIRSMWGATKILVLQGQKINFILDNILDVRRYLI